MSKKPKTFIFHLWKRFLDNYKMVKWRIKLYRKIYIVDAIECNVDTETYTFLEKAKPKAAMRGRGIIRFEYYKEDGYKKTKAIIE